MNHLHPTCEYEYDTDQLLTLSWAWVLEHATMIDRISLALCRGTGLDADDFKQSVVLRVVERWQHYDSSKGKPSTWVTWQARAVRKEHLRWLRRRKNEAPLEPCNHPVRQPGGEARAMLVQLHDMASDDEWAATVATAQGYQGEQLGALCGCAPYSARRRVARLRERAVTTMAS